MTAWPPGASAATSVAFSRAMPASEPTPSRWTGATLVTIATSGRMTSAETPSSPGMLMPASMTAKRCRPGSTRRSISGTPMRLLRLASVTKA